MRPVSNRNPLTLTLYFHDAGGSGMDYTFQPGEVVYDATDGLVISFDLQMKDGSTAHIALKPVSNTESLLQFLAPFALTYHAGKKFTSIAGRNVYSAFTMFLAANLVARPVKDYLDSVKTKNSSYYRLDEDHELCIRKPMYVRV